MPNPAVGPQIPTSAALVFHPVQLADWRAADRKAGHLEFVAVGSRPGVCDVLRYLTQPVASGEEATDWRAES